MHPGEWKQDSANETTINVFECALDGRIEGTAENTPGSTFKCAHQDFMKDTQEGVFQVKLKGTPKVAPELKLFMKFPMHMSGQNDPIKGEFEETLYDEPEGALRISH